MIEKLRAMFRNRITLLMPVAGLLFSASFSFMIYSIFFAKINMGVVLGLAVFLGIISPEDAMAFIRVLQIISVGIFLVMPFILTIATGKFILRMKRDQLTVNYATYLNPISVAHFEDQEVEGPRNSPISDLMSSLGIAVSQTETMQNDRVKIDYPTVEVPDELPAYDPNGPSPFKKK